jgi:type IV pilus assembly protein PilW
MIVKQDHGVTLIELLIVMVIAAILVAGIYSLFITQQRSYAVQDQVTGVQQDARVALDIMARDIRMAGFLIGSKGFNVNTYTFAITPANSSTSPDSITVAGATDQFMSGGIPVTVTGVAGNAVTLSANIGSFFDTGTNSYVAFEDDITKTLYQISDIDNNTLTVTPAPPAYLVTITDKTGATVGAGVFRVKAITYSVSNGSLLRNDNTSAGPQPLAGDGINTTVEDLQFAYQVQGNTTNWYNTPAEAGATNDAIKMVRISITIRTGVPDPASTAQFYQPPLEDHTTGLNGPDGFRRRVYTTVVKVRNLWGTPPT